MPEGLLTGHQRAQPPSTSARSHREKPAAASARSASSSQDVALAFGSFAVASAIFLILELNQPFSGLFRVPSAPIERAIAVLGKSPS